MDYTANDFVNMLYNPYPIGAKVDILKQFPVFGLYPVFRETIYPISINKVLRYIMYAFDPQSPLSSINDIIQRRVEAAMLAGFVIVKNKFSKDIDKVIRSGNSKVNHMIVQYCVMLNEDDFSVLVAYQDTLRKQLEQMMDGEAEDAKSLISNTNTLRKEISELKLVLTDNNLDKFLSRSLMEFTDGDRLSMSPEQMAVHTKDWDNISRYYTPKA